MCGCWTDALKSRVPTTTGSCLLREGGGVLIEGRCVGSAARAGLAGREIRFSDNEAR